MKNLKKMFLVTLIVSCSFVATIASAKEAAIYAGMDTAQPVWAKSGMVSSQQRLATDVGVSILEQGGNAVDAAVAVGYALAVVYPRAGNIGGGGFMVVYMAETKEVVTIDYREMAPAKAHADIFLDNDNNVDRNKALFHGLSTGVPGSVMGMELALKTYGSMTLKQVMAPAINLAENGYIVTHDFARSLKGLKKRMEKWLSTMAIFQKPNGVLFQEGDLFVQKDLAKTLRIIADEGSKGFYQGEVAEKIAAAIQKAGGLMTVEDLANYKALIRKPVTTNYRGYDVYSMPPPSSGGIHLVQILNMLENSDIGEMGHNSAATIHQMAESMKYAYADRSEYLGDPDYYKVPMKALIDKAYAKSLFEKIDPLKALPSDEIKPGKLTPYESDQTTHYSVVDKWGNSVSTTTTLNLSYGSGLVADGTGVLMNNEMDDFSSKPGEPNAYGLLGGVANAIEAGKRPLSAMTPTIVLKDGKPYLITGSPGGSRIITTTLQIVMNVIDHHMNIAEASSAQRIHHQWYPDEIRIERGLNKDTKALLEAKGHKLKVKSAMGSTQTIMVTPDGLLGAPDPRSRDAKAAGF